MKEKPKPRKAREWTLHIRLNGDQVKGYVHAPDVEHSPGVKCALIRVREVRRRKGK